MKLSTARRLVCMSYFTVDGLRPLLATATRIVCSGDTKRFLFPDGSVIESTKGNWKVVSMEKNEKLEAALKRFGGFAEGGYTGESKSQIAGVVRSPESFVIEANARSSQIGVSTIIVTDGLHAVKSFISETDRLQMKVLALQELCNEKDEQIDKANEAVMVVRLDWWLIGLVALVLVAHYGFGVL